MSDEVDENEAIEGSAESYDSSDPKSVNNARKKEARKHKELLEVTKALMDLPAGRAWFYDRLIKCHCFETPFINGDQSGTAFRCGEQNVGLQILADIQAAASDQYVQMITEAKQNG